MFGDRIDDDYSLHYLSDLSKAKLLLHSIPYLYCKTTEEIIPRNHAHVGHKFLSEKWWNVEFLPLGTVLY